MGLFTSSLVRMCSHNFFTQEFEITFDILYKYYENLQIILGNTVGVSVLTRDIPGGYQNNLW